MNLTRDDYKGLADPAPPPIPDIVDPMEPVANLKVKSSPTNVIEPPIPDIAEILAAPKPPKLGESKLVSVAVTDDVPLKDVLIEMARLAEVDIEIDASITGGVSFRAKDRPFNEVIERVANLAGLRYNMKNGVLRVERDTPYVQIYSLDFLNMDRSSSSSVSISTNVLSGGSGGGGGGGSSGGASGGSGGGGGGGGGGSGGLNTGSSSSVTSKSESDFWKQFDSSIHQILSYSESKRISSANIAEQVPAKPAEAPAAAAGGLGAGLGLGMDKPAAAAAPAPKEASGGAGSAGGNTTNKEGAEGATFTLNRQGSTMTVSATDRQHSLIKEFLRRIQTNSSAQVLIEAKIVEVTLDNEFQSGIDWTKFGTNKFGFTGNFDTPAAAINKNSASIAIGSPHPIAVAKNFDLTAAVKLAEEFGTTRTLSSPRLHAINNQEAVLTFAKNFVYFELTATQTQSATTTTTPGTTSGLNTLTINSTLHTVPIGIIMTLQPSINIETGEVTLSVHPTLSRITGTVSDPAVDYIIGQAKAQGITVNATNAVPVIEVRELDSILKLKSGQVMVIGGLMQDVSSNLDSGVPGLMNVPVLGSAFKGVDKANTVQELVIFIRATIVDSNGNAAPADKTLYDKFTKDPRPLEFQ